MGVDIRIAIMNKKTNEILLKDGDIYDGRNSEWFHNISKAGDYDEIYCGFPVNRLMSFENIDKEGKIKEWLTEQYHEDWEFDWLDNYNYCLVSAEDFCDWYDTTLPFKKSGWARKYDWFLYDKTGKVPEFVIKYLDPTIVDFVEDWEFRTYYEVDPSQNLLKILVDYRDILEDLSILYCFNC